jgi:hypothetical protein
MAPAAIVKFSQFQICGFDSEDEIVLFFRFQPGSIELPVQGSCTKLATGRSDGSALRDGGLARFQKVNLHGRDRRIGCNERYQDLAEHNPSISELTHR